MKHEATHDDHATTTYAATAAVRLPPTPPESPALALGVAVLPPTTALPDSPCALGSLPAETLHHVLSYLNPPALAQVARVSRPLLALARAHLYRQLSLRNQCEGAAAPVDASPLDARSAALVQSLEQHPLTLAPLAHGLDFDLLSHLGADDVARLLGRILTLCTSLTRLRLGAGSHGHGIGFRGLYRSLALAPPGAASRLRQLDVAACAGAPHTLAMLLLEMPALVELRIGQCLLEEEDQAVFCHGRTAPCRLETLVARGRLTPTAFTFCTASSGPTLRRAVLPICDDERAALDLSPFVALADLELSVFLWGAPTPFSPAHASFGRAMIRLTRNFASTLESLPAVRSPGSASGAHRATVGGVVVALSGAWDCAVTAPPGASQAVDLVLHADLLDALPREGVERLVVRTELNAIALARWLHDDAWWGPPRNPSPLSDEQVRDEEVADSMGSRRRREQAGGREQLLGPPPLPARLGRRRSSELPPSPVGSTASAPSISTCVPSPIGSPSPSPSASPSPPSPSLRATTALPAAHESSLAGGAAAAAPPALQPPSVGPYSALRAPDLRCLELWQKTSYSAARRDFQARVRDRVDEGARRRGVQVCWRSYERW